jgi:hypothetical protein
MRLEHLKTHRMIHTGEKPFQVKCKKKKKVLFLIRNGTGPHWTLSLEYSIKDPDPVWIRIRIGSGFGLDPDSDWIRIRIGSGFNRVSGSGSDAQSGSKRTK